MTAPGVHRNGVHVDPPQRTVVLVGPAARRTCEGAIRPLSDVALVRVDSACDAMGEIAHPVSLAGGDPIVLIGVDALPDDKGGAWSAAIRRLLAGVTLVRVADAAGLAPEGFDALICADGPLDAIHALLAGRGAADQPSSESVASPGDDDRSQTPARIPREESSASVDEARTARSDFDAAALEAILRGESPADVAMATIRTALGDPDAAFITGDPSAPVGPADGQPVERHGKRFGWLCASSPPSNVVAQAASWLGALLALDAQSRSLREAAFVDELTGAWNRRYFSRFLEMAITRARKQRSHLTLMIFDIDNFKSYNDNYGHPAGDTILRQTVHLLKSDIRPTDRVCRIGGDEFAVIFDDPEGSRKLGSMPPRTIAEITLRFQRQICEHHFPELAELAPGTLTISGGLATFPWDAGDVESLIHNADQLALASKRQGKNLLTFGPGAEQVCRIAGLGSDEDAPQE